MTKLHFIAKNKHFRGVTLSAQVRVEYFYTQLGYTKRGPVYDDVGIPHQNMDLILK